MGTGRREANRHRREHREHCDCGHLGGDARSYSVVALTRQETGDKTPDTRLTIHQRRGEIVGEDSDGDRDREKEREKIKNKTTINTPLRRPT